MKMFKNWFSKQDKEESQDDLSNSKAVIIFGADNNEENFIQINFEPEYKYRLAEMIFMLNSGLLIDDMLHVLKQICGDDEEMVFDIVKRLDEISKSVANDESDPVVDPCEVFNKRSDNEFKG